MERCTIVVGTRDRFSTLIACLERIRACTPEPHDLIVVAGGAPEALRQEWQRRYGNQAKFIFERQFLNQAQARNLGMRDATTTMRSRAGRRRRCARNGKAVSATG